MLDAVPTPRDIDKALARLEAMAREHGVAVGVAARAAGHDRAHRAMGEGRRGARHRAGADQRGRDQAEVELKRQAAPMLMFVMAGL